MSYTGMRKAAMIGREGSSQGTGYDPGLLALDYVAKGTSVPADGWDRVPPRWGAAAGCVAIRNEMPPQGLARHAAWGARQALVPEQGSSRTSPGCQDGGRSSVGRPIGGSGNKSQ